MVIFRGLIMLMAGFACCWGLPGCGEEKPEVVQEEIVNPATEEVERENVEVEEGVEEEGAEQEGGAGEGTPSGNTPPTITNAKILPVPTQANTDLRVEVEAEDPDGDWINYSYQWVVVRAGGTLEDLEELEDQTGETLSHELFSREDAIAVRITPSDWYSEGEQFSTKLVTIGNAPPQIVSSPSGASSDLYTYQVKAEDPDGDSFVYKFGESPPSGMSIDAKTGLLTWDTTKAGAGEHMITIHVHDKHGGNAYQRFSLSLSGDVGTEKEEIIEEAGQAEEENEGEDLEAVEEAANPNDSEEYEKTGVNDEGDQPEESLEFEELEEPEEADQW